MEFFSKFESLCKAKGITPTHAARDIGITQQAVSMWKKRGSIPKYETLKKIADYFETTVENLLGFSKEEQNKIEETVNLLQYAGQEKERAHRIAIKDNQRERLLRKIDEAAKDALLEFNDQELEEMLLEAFRDLPANERVLLTYQASQQAHPYIGKYRQVIKEKMNNAPEHPRAMITTKKPSTKEG